MREMSAVLVDLKAPSRFLWGVNKVYRSFTVTIVFVELMAHCCLLQDLYHDGNTGIADTIQSSQRVFYYPSNNHFQIRGHLGPCSVSCRKKIITRVIALLLYLRTFRGIIIRRIICCAISVIKLRLMFYLLCLLTIKLLNPIKKFHIPCVTISVSIERFK